MTMKNQKQNEVDAHGGLLMSQVFQMRRCRTWPRQ